MGMMLAVGCTTTTRREAMFLGSLSTGTAAGGRSGRSRGTRTRRLERRGVSGDGDVGYVDVTIDINRQTVPVSIWYPRRRPMGNDGREEKERWEGKGRSVLYPHAISVRKIARVLLGDVGEWLPQFLFDRDVPLPAAPWVYPGSSSSLPPNDMIDVGSVRGGCILCHGYLGSRFDLVDFAESLGRAGFVTFCPEFAESLARDSTTPNQQRSGAAPPKISSASRAEIMEATLKKLEAFGLQGRNICLLGHSAGAGTVLSTEGPYSRIAIAGFRTQEPTVLTQNPLLVIASEGDGVISLYPKENGRFGPSQGISAAVETLPGDVFRIPGNQVHELVGGGEVPRVAFVSYEGSPPAAPTHISFLSSRTNAAMIETLSPLLPLAAAMDIPVLDFDVYSKHPDSDEVGEKLVPAVVDWLCKMTPPTHI